jgi:hypothetical protein
MEVNRNSWQSTYKEEETAEFVLVTELANLPEIMIVHKIVNV